MKLSFYYCDTKLGDLEKTEKGYMYTSNIAGEQKLKNQGAVTDSEYSLWNSFKREKKILFPEFEHIIYRCRREDIMEMAGIDPNDSRWGKLVKLSSLNFLSGFHLKQSNETS